MTAHISGTGHRPQSGSRTGNGHRSRHTARATLFVLALVTAGAGLPAAAQAAPTAGTFIAAAEAGAQDTPYVFTDLSASTFGTDYDNREITLVGRLMRHDPDGGPDVPAANETVDIVQQWFDEWGDPVPDEPLYTPMGQPVTTDALGRFELVGAQAKARDLNGGLPVPDDFTIRPHAARRIDPNGPANTGNWDAMGSWGGMGGDTSDARIRADLTKSPAGGPTRTVTVEGVFERKQDAVWRPLKNYTAMVEFRPEDGTGSFKRALRTAADGSFDTTVAVPEDGTVVTWVDDWTKDPYLDLTGDRAQGVAVGIPDAMELQSGPYALGRDRTLTASARIVGTGDCDVDGQKLVLQRSANGRTGWTKAASVLTGADGRAALELPGASSGYYRWYHAADDLCAEDTGYVKELRRAETRIQSFNAAPEPLRRGQKLVVSGVLQDKPATKNWTAYRNRPVEVWFKAPGGAWSRVSVVTSNAKGYFQKTVTANRTGDWRAVHTGDAGHFNVTGPTDHVDVKN